MKYEVIKKLTLYYGHDREGNILVSITPENLPEVDGRTQLQVTTPDPVLLPQM
ncbi:MAG: hypothetical protein QW356_07010 [Candidatus Hadarchaeales archaeon]